MHKDVIRYLNRKIALEAVGIIETVVKSAIIRKVEIKIERDLRNLILDGFDSKVLDDFGKFYPMAIIHSNIDVIGEIIKTARMNHDKLFINYPFQNSILTDIKKILKDM